jgi:hypothetical protein
VRILLRGAEIERRCDFDGPCNSGDEDMALAEESASTTAP